MRISPAWFLLLGIPLLHASDTPGLTITVQRVFGGIASDQTMYIEKDRRRTEVRASTATPKRPDGSRDIRYGPWVAWIGRCDLGQTFALNLDTAEYEAHPDHLLPKPLSKEETEALGLNVPQFSASDKPTLRIETTTVDTGERKDFFGHTARHVITTTKEIPLEGSKSDPRETVNDGWYIDLDASISCDWKPPAGERVHAHVFGGVGNVTVEKIEFIDNGEPETGFAIESKITWRGTTTSHDGTKRDFTSTNEMRVTQFVEGPLDPALFTIPTGFRQVEHIERNEPSSTTTLQVLPVTDSTGPSR